MRFFFKLGLWMLLLCACATGARAQQYEVTCPAGTTVLSTAEGTTFNSVTGKFRQNICIDNNGNLFNNITGGLTVKSLENVQYADQFAGADWAAKVNAAYAAVGTGGTVFVSSALVGNASTAISISSPNSVRIIFDQGTFTYTGAAQAILCTSTNAPIIEGSGFQGGGSANGTIFSVTNTAANGFDFNVCPGALIRNLTIQGPSSGTGKGLIITGNSMAVENVVVKNFGGNGCEENGTRGNSNGIRMWGVRCANNGGIGLNVFGANGNLNDFYEVEVSNNTGLGAQIATCCNYFSPIHSFSNNAGTIGISFASGAANNSGEIYSDVGTQTTDLAELSGANNNGIIRLVSGQTFTDAGTNNFTLTSQMFGSTNSATVPFYSFQNDRTTGFFDAGGNSEGWSSGGVDKFHFLAGSVRQGANQVYAWGSAADPSAGGNDTGLSRDSAGVVDIGNGFVGDKSAKVRSSLYVADGGAACTNGELAFSAGFGNTPNAVATLATGFSQTCEWLVTAGTAGLAANPTITDTLVVPLLNAATVCDMRMVGGTGTTTLIDQTTASTTTPTFTFGGTPGAGLTYKIVRRCGP